MRATVSLRDGRWVAVGLLLVYYLVLGLAGPPADLATRWRQAGVYAYPAPFIDLQVFPAARATVAAGGELYGPSVTDPMQRPYNYPRVWLAFMRFPAEAAWLRTLGGLGAAAAVVTLLLLWGPLSVGEGLVGGLLLCSPAFQLGIERGNTDLIILVLVGIGLRLAGDEKLAPWASAAWWLAAVLKLFPLLALGAWFGGSARTWLRRVWPPLALFAVYLVLTRHDLAPVLRNTGGGWVQSYGSEVLALAWSQVQSFYGTKAPGDFPLPGLGRCLAAAGLAWILVRGWLGRPDVVATEPAMTPPERRAQLGFRTGALVYLATFVAGSSFDYRQCFLLLALPQLFAWRRAGRPWAMVALGALVFSLGLNYLLAGWPGFVLKEAAGWLLLFVLAKLLVGTWRRGEVALTERTVPYFSA